jgi:hypothetical protein
LVYTRYIPGIYIPVIYDFMGIPVIYDFMGIPGVEFVESNVKIKIVI